MTDWEQTTNTSDGSEEVVLEHITESPEALLAALEGAEVGIFILGPDFSVEWINETTERYFGISREAVTGTDKQSLIESTIQSRIERPDRFRETVTATYEDNSYVEEFECHVLPGDGHKGRWLLHRSHPIRDGALAGGRIEHYTDITEQKKREQGLESKNERLEQFAKVVSHDLRNPLNAASLQLELLEKESDSEYVEMAGSALERMERIIDDMLWLARKGKDIGETKPVRVRESLDAAWTIAVGDRDRVDLVIDEETPETIIADPDRLRQLLENLFANAIEHAGRDVTVTVGGVENGLYLADDGPGIPETDLEMVFDSGYSTAPGGTGYGLHIVYRIVKAHGWEIHLTDSVDGGARFELTGVTDTGE